MKTNKLHLFTFLAIGALIALGPIARADDAPAAPAPGADAGTNGPAGGRPNMRAQMEKLFTAISATDEQKEKLKPIFKERNEKFKALRDDTSLSQEDRKSKRQEIIKDINAKVKDVLSADQFEEYLKFQKAQVGRGGRAQQSTPPAADTTPKN
jgi:protein CpxP